MIALALGLGTDRSGVPERGIYCGRILKGAKPADPGFRKRSCSSNHAQGSKAMSQASPAPQEQDRYPYSAIVDRKPLRWPNVARVAVWVIPNIEHFLFDRPST